MNNNPMAIKVVEVPNFSVNGPATISPRGASANEPTASYEVTRESDSRGMLVCIAVCHRTKKKSNAMPAKNALTIISGTQLVTPIVKIQPATAT